MHTSDDSHQPRINAGKLQYNHNRARKARCTPPLVGEKYAAKTPSLIPAICTVVHQITNAQSGDTGFTDAFHHTTHLTSQLLSINIPTQAHAYGSINIGGPPECCCSAPLPVSIPYVILYPPLSCCALVYARLSICCLPVICSNLKQRFRSANTRERGNSGSSEVNNLNASKLGASPRRIYALRRLTLPGQAGRSPYTRNYDYRR